MAFEDDDILIDPSLELSDRIAELGRFALAIKEERDHLLAERAIAKIVVTNCFRALSHKGSFAMNSVLLELEALLLGALK